MSRSTLYPLGDKKRETIINDLRKGNLPNENKYRYSTFGTTEVFSCVNGSFALKFDSNITESINIKTLIFLDTSVLTLRTDNRGFIVTTNSPIKLVARISHTED